MARQNDFPQMKRMTMLARLCELLQMTGLGNLQYIHEAVIQRVKEARQL